MLNKHDLTHAARCMLYLAIIQFSLEYSSFVCVNDLSERNYQKLLQTGIAAIKILYSACCALHQPPCFACVQPALFKIAN